MLILKNLRKAYAGRTLFEGVDFTLNWGERVALVGPNGAGKSTLFRLIQGVEEADEGRIERDEYAVIGFLDQEAGDPGEETVLELAMGIDEEMVQILRTMHLAEASGDTGSAAFAEAQDRFNERQGYQLEPKAKRVLSGLGFRDADFHRPAWEMSGGWVMRARLARLLVLEPDLLLLDEPTNHLDLMALLWFQRHLRQYSGGLLVISHDRDFLDEVAETVVEIDGGVVSVYQGNYTSYLGQRDERYERRLRAWRNQQKEIERVQRFIDEFRSVTSKAAQVQSRVRQLEKLEVLPKPRAPRKVFSFQFPQPPRSMRRVIELEGVRQAYGDHEVYRNLDFTVERGDRIVLVGPNGAGKSTLLKILAGLVPIQAGERRVGNVTRIGYFSQHRSEGLDPNGTVLDEVMTASPELREEEARSILGSFLFRRADVMKRTSVLSGGEKSRLNLVKFLVNPPNLLLMDEPTTHLDLLSVEALIGALSRFEGSLVFISHDVHFIRAVAETTVHISGAAPVRYAGGFDYFLEKSGLLDDRAAVTAAQALAPGRKQADRPS